MWDILIKLIAAVIAEIFGVAITTPGTVTEVDDATETAPLPVPATSVDDLLDMYGGVRADP